MLAAMTGLSGIRPGLVYWASWPGRCTSCPSGSTRCPTRGWRGSTPSRPTASPAPSRRPSAPRRDARCRPAAPATGPRPTASSACPTRREMFRTVEDDPRDLTAARKYLGVYLMGARDATTKFADLTRPPGRRGQGRLFRIARRSRSRLRGATRDAAGCRPHDLDVEIEVLRDRLNATACQRENENGHQDTAARPPRIRPRSRRSRPFRCRSRAGRSCPSRPSARARRRSRHPSAHGRVRHDGHPVDHRLRVGRPGRTAADQPGDAGRRQEQGCRPRGRLACAASSRPSAASR